MPAYMRIIMKFLHTCAHYLVRDFKEIQFSHNKKKFFSKTLDYLEYQHNLLELEGEYYLDGRENFIMGIPLCTLVYRKNDWIVIYDFLHQTIYWTWNGQMFKDDTPLIKDTKRQTSIEFIVPKSLQEVWEVMGRLDFVHFQEEKPEEEESTLKLSDFMEDTQNNRTLS